MKTLIFFLTAYLLLLTSTLSAQITFQKTFGGIDFDEGYSVQQTTDGGYIITGTTYSFGAGGEDVYLIRTDANGDTLWTKTFGGTVHDYCRSVRQTTDGGYIIAGKTLGSGAGSMDVYLIKTDVNGDSLWTRAFGGAGWEEGYLVQQTTDGGYIITGVANSLGAGNEDVYLAKSDSNGNLLWTKTYGGSGDDGGYSVQQTTDGGYIFTGYTNSFGAGGEDVYLIKTDTSGFLLWKKTFGGASDDAGSSVQQTTDGGYIVTGYTNSFGGGDNDVYLIRTDANGDTLWSKIYGRTNFDEGESVQQTTDGGYIISGNTNSFGAAYANVYLIKTDANGDTLWTRIFGAGSDWGNCVQQTTDGGYIIGGFTNNLGAGNFDFYLIKTDSMGNSGCNEGTTTTIVTTPATQVSSPPINVNFPGGIQTTPITIVGSGGTVTTLCTTVDIPALSFGEGSGVRLSPNPSSGDFMLTFPNAINRGDVEIFNAYGAKVFAENIYNTSNTEIHLKPVRLPSAGKPSGGNIPGGIYFLKVFDGEKYFSNKIIIQQN